MTTQPCDGCGQAVTIAGGIGNFWTLSPEPTGGVELEFEDGSEHFLCMRCVDLLPDYPTADDVAAIEPDEDD